MCYQALPKSRIQMSEVVELESLIKNLQKQLSHESEELRKAVASATGTTARTETLKTIASPAGEKSCSKSHSTSKLVHKKTKKVEEKEKKVTLDFEIPTCYGSIELREALTIAQKRLKTACDVMEKTKHQIPSQYVQNEMENLHKSFAVLRLAFSSRSFLSFLWVTGLNLTHTKLSSCSPCNLPFPLIGCLIL